MTDTNLLDYADAVLDGTIPLQARGPRTAALLARCAFEEWLDVQCASWAPASQARPTTRSKLAVLGTRQGVATGDEAKRLWHGLSRAVHHHAYELQPAAIEVKDLVRKVRALCAQTSI